MCNRKRCITALPPFGGKAEGIHIGNRVPVYICVYVQCAGICYISIYYIRTHKPYQVRIIIPRPHIQQSVGVCQYPVPAVVPKDQLIEMRLLPSSHRRAYRCPFSLKKLLLEPFINSINLSQKTSSVKGKIVFLHKNNLGKFTIPTLSFWTNCLIGI